MHCYAGSAWTLFTLFTLLGSVCTFTLVECWFVVCPSPHTPTLSSPCCQVSVSLYLPTATQSLVLVVDYIFVVTLFITCKRCFRPVFVKHCPVDRDGAIALESFPRTNPCRRIGLLSCAKANANIVALQYGRHGGLLGIPLVLRRRPVRGSMRWWWWG